MLNFFISGTLLLQSTCPIFPSFCNNKNTRSHMKVSVIKYSDNKLIWFESTCKSHVGFINSSSALATIKSTNTWHTTCTASGLCHEGDGGNKSAWN